MQVEIRCLNLFEPDPDSNITDVYPGGIRVIWNHDGSRIYKVEIDAARSVFIDGKECN